MSAIELSRSLLLWLSPAVIGALWTIVVILYKGEICPGQRGRLHKSIVVLTGLTAALCLAQVWFVLPAALMGYFVSQIQFKKTRVEGPRAALVIAAVMATLIACLSFSAQLTQPYLWTGIVGFALFSALVALLGASLAHLLLVRARTRLQAFHRILPVAAIVASFVYLLLWLLLVWANIDANLLSSQALIEPMLLALPLLIASIVVWCWHLFSHKEIKQHALWVSTALLSTSHLILVQLLP